MSFDKKKYDIQYRKDHYSKLSVDLPKETKQKLVEICNECGISIKQFILDAIQSKEKDLKKSHK